MQAACNDDDEYDQEKPGGSLINQPRHFSCCDSAAWSCVQLGHSLSSSLWAAGTSPASSHACSPWAPWVKHKSAPNLSASYALSSLTQLRSGGKPSATPAGSTLLTLDDAHRYCCHTFITGLTAGLDEGSGSNLKMALYICCELDRWVGAPDAGILDPPPRILDPPPQHPASCP